VHAAAACDTVKVCDAMVSVPVRAEALGFAPTVNKTEPLPVPLGALVTVIQLSLLAADQGQPAPAVMFEKPFPPAADADMLVAESPKVQPAPACVTVKTSPPTVSVPTRCDVLALFAAENCTEPLPVPDAPPVTVNQPVLLLTAVHEQPAWTVTPVEPVPPPAATDWLACESEYEHAAPACVTVNV